MTARRHSNQEDDGPDLGPDERDRDLLDGSWERRYYSGRVHRFDWNTIAIGLSLLALAGFLGALVLGVMSN